ncbi:hypothetical protein Thiowin_01179 [Thiorhodovibrio winogradskyi]|uniref:DUF2726 domain-containing protein n=1 Tax=Thiorhodovibrio winogradskyi TaxID=77007 RepID=A0ABZ0S7W0_9GAMM|nr:DUF2726 domain-containing protein [Thiorhodovibrio winogradskyi]
MTQFYLLLALVALALINLLLSLASKGRSTGGARGSKVTIKRRRPMLNALEARSLRLLEQLLGTQRRVQAQVPLYRLIGPSPKVGVRRARQWRAEVADLSADLAVLSADGTEPLCAILLTASGKQARRVRREQARVQSLCRQADLPVLTLSGSEQDAPETLKARLEELIWPLEESLVSSHPVASEDEDALLAALAAAMRDRSVAQRPSRR